MKIFTWNKLWSRPNAETLVKGMPSIHPGGRTERYREKNRTIRLRKKAHGERR